MENHSAMSVATIKSELRDIADHIPDTASYSDAMYQLYVRMKVAKGRQAADEGRVVSHDEVKRKFAK
jgi:predicted transcriptional regulator